jgi:hypothetical protein
MPSTLKASYNLNGKAKTHLLQFVYLFIIGKIKILLKTLLNKKLDNLFLSDTIQKNIHR